MRPQAQAPHVSSPHVSAVVANWGRHGVELFTERAAIMAADGGLTPAEADEEALQSTYDLFWGRFLPANDLKSPLL